MRLQELLETSQISELFQPGKKNRTGGRIVRSAEDTESFFNAMQTL